MRRKKDRNVLQLKRSPVHPLINGEFYVILNVFARTLKYPKFKCASFEELHCLCKLCKPRGERRVTAAEFSNWFWSAVSAKSLVLSEGCQRLTSVHFPVQDRTVRNTWVRTLSRYRFSFLSHVTMIPATTSTMTHHSFVSAEPSQMTPYFPRANVGLHDGLSKK